MTLAADDLEGLREEMRKARGGEAANSRLM